MHYIYTYIYILLVDSSKHSWCRSPDGLRGRHPHRAPGQEGHHPSCQVLLERILQICINTGSTRSQSCQVMEGHCSSRWDAEGQNLRQVVEGNLPSHQVVKGKYNAVR